MLKRLSELFSDLKEILGENSGSAHSDPVLEQLKQKLQEQIAEHNRLLAAHAAVCERVRGQILELEGEAARSRERTAEALRHNQRDAAERSALHLQRIRHELETRRQGLGEAEEKLKDLASVRDALVKAAQLRLDQLREERSRSHGMQPEAEITSLLPGMEARMQGASGAFQRLNQLTDKKLPASWEVSAAGIPVAAEEKYLAEEALAEFQRLEGLTATASAQTRLP